MNIAEEELDKSQSDQTGPMLHSHVPAAQPGLHGLLVIISSILGSVNLALTMAHW